MSDDSRIVVRLANGDWLYLSKRKTYCRNCDGGGGCMDCVLRYDHDKCDPKSCPICEGALKVETYEIEPYSLDHDSLEANRVTNVHF